MFSYILRTCINMSIGFNIPIPTDVVCVLVQPTHPTWTTSLMVRWKKLRCSYPYTQFYQSYECLYIQIKKHCKWCLSDKHRVSAYILQTNQPYDNHIPKSLSTLRCPYIHRSYEYGVSRKRTKSLQKINRKYNRGQQMIF